MPAAECNQLQGGARQQREMGRLCMPPYKGSGRLHAGDGDG